MSKFRADGAVCVVLIDYVDDLTLVDARMKAHVAWLDRHLADGTLLVGGRQHPRVGGVLIARGGKAAVEALAATDPFVAHGVASSRVIEFNASFALPEIAALLA